MSGPKVVRIRTREELEAEARAQLCRVEAAHKRLERVARRCDAWSDERAAALAGRRAMLEQMLARQRWNEVARTARAECDGVEREVTRVQAEAARAREATETRRRRARDLARSVIQQLERTGKEVPNDLRLAEQAAIRATDAELATVERRVSRHAVGLLRPAEPAASAGAPELARRLGTDAHEASNAGATSLPGARTLSEQEAKIVAGIAQLEVSSPDAALRFRERLAGAEGEPDWGRRSLLIDSVVLELSREIAAQRAWEAAHARAEGVALMLAETADGDSAGVRRALESALAGQDTTALAAATETAEAHLAHVGRRRAAEARRRAVLSALTALGYEVREGMETALAERGRVVVRKGAIPDYGVEVAAVADSARFQVRVVGSRSAHRTPARDRDAEQRWCGEVETLRSSLNASGAEFEIERARAPGEAPVKTVEFGIAEQDEGGRAKRPPARRRTDERQ